jgi:hypothetical protein
MQLVHGAELFDTASDPLDDGGLLSSVPVPGTRATYNVTLESSLATFFSPRLDEDDKNTPELPEAPSME